MIEDKNLEWKEVKKLNEQIRSKTSSNNNNIRVYASKAIKSIVEKYNKIKANMFREKNREIEFSFRIYGNRFI